MNWGNRHAKYDDLDPSFRGNKFKPYMPMARTGSTSDSYQPFNRKKRGRPAGISLKAGEVGALVAQALSAGGPISQGEAFEHLLVVVCDETRYHGYHFIVAPAHVPGDQRRAMLLSARTLHGISDQTDAYAKRLVAYADALGSPRVVIDPMSSGAFLIRTLTFGAMSHGMRWSCADMWSAPQDNQLRAAYQDNYAMGLARLKAGALNGVVHYPPINVLAQQIATMAPKKTETGQLYLNDPAWKMEHELLALCINCVDEDDDRGPSEFEHFYRGH